MEQRLHVQMHFSHPTHVGTNFMRALNNSGNKHRR